MSNYYSKPDKDYISEYGKVKYNVFGSGEPLILVHGTPWSSYNWRKIIPALSQWFTVYYYDLLGYGESDKNVRDVSLGVQNEILFELIQFWELDNPRIIGHDFGGATVLRTHLLNKQNFKKIILIDPVAISPWGSEFYKYVEKYKDAFLDIPSYIHEAIFEKYIDGATFEAMSKKDIKNISKPWNNIDGKKAFYNQIVQSSQIYTDEVEKQYSKINVPICLIWGKEDQWIPYDQGIKLKKLIPNSELILINDAGHLVQEDQATILFSNILKFMKC